MQKISRAEWDIAKAEFARVPDRTWLPRSRDKKGVHRDREHLTYQLSHSFVKIGGKIYALARGKKRDAVIGQGSYGCVKYAIDEEGRHALIKVIISHPSASSSHSRISLESKLLEDRQLSDGHVFRQRFDPSKGFKYYIHMVHLGTELKRKLTESPSRDQRFHWAIGACLAVADLHSGRGSNSGKPCAHLDIKPENFTVDRQGNVHLIDLGFATRAPGKALDHNQRVGTRAYISPYSQTPVDADRFALWRTLFFPANTPFQLRDDSTREFSATRARKRSILTPEMVRSHDLAIELFTGNEGGVSVREHEHISPIIMAAMLINARYGLGYQITPAEEDFCNRLVEAYRQGVHPLMYSFVTNVPPIPADEDEVSMPDTTRDDRLLRSVDALDLIAQTSETISPGAFKALKRIVNSVHAVCSVLPPSRMSQEQLVAFQSALKTLIDATHQCIAVKPGPLLTVLSSLTGFYPHVLAYQRHTKNAYSFFNKQLSQIEKEAVALSSKPAASVTP